MKYYSSAIGNFAIHHLPFGGIYLVGSLTNSIIHKIKKTDILKDWK
jgi:glucokinase